jgi:outer membrane biosynthesis protein TonB
MAIEERALEAWLEPDNDHIPPAALRPLYGKLPPSVTQALESARRGMRDGFVRGVLDAHAILAGNVGDDKVSFKEWIEAAGIKYETARSIVKRNASRAKRATPDPEPKPEPNPESEQADKGASNPRSPASDEDDEPEPADEPEPEDDPKPEPAPDPKPKPERKPQGKRQLVLHVKNDEERADLIARLRAVAEGEVLATDQWAEIVLCLLDFYETHQPHAQSAEEAA